MDKTPTSIQRDGDQGIVIQWSDGIVSRWTASQLRKECPCALCREKKRGEDKQAVSDGPMMLPVLAAAEAKPLTIDQMKPIGNYAYNVRFSDGHSSGLFTLDMLYK